MALDEEMRGAFAPILFLVLVTRKIDVGNVFPRRRPDCQGGVQI